MKNEVKKNWQRYFTIALVMLIPIVSGSTTLPITESNCLRRQASAMNQLTGSVSLSWNSVSGASEYVIFYIREDDNYTSPQTYTRNTSITYSGLPSGKYIFYLAKVCGGELSEFIIIEDLVI